MWLILRSQKSISDRLLNCAIYEKIIAQFSAVPFWFDKDTRSIVDGGNPADRA
jgi:hypothetical protein